MEKQDSTLDSTNRRRRTTLLLPDSPSSRVSSRKSDPCDQNMHETYSIFQGIYNGTLFRLIFSLWSMKLPSSLPVSSLFPPRDLFFPSPFFLLCTLTVTRSVAMRLPHRSKIDIVKVGGETESRTGTGTGTSKLDKRTHCCI